MSYCNKRAPFKRGPLNALTLYVIYPTCANISDIVVIQLDKTFHACVKGKEIYWLILRLECKRERDDSEQCHMKYENIPYSCCFERRNHLQSVRVQMVLREIISRYSAFPPVDASNCFTTVLLSEFLNSDTLVKKILAYMMPKIFASSEVSTYFF